MSPDFSDSEILNTLVRMVVPIKREFGRALDVRQFLRDSQYAEELLGVALGSQDPRLLEYARYVERRLHGARIAHGAPHTPAATQAPATAPPAPPTAAPAAGAAGTPDDETALRDRVLKKYTGGLR